MAIFMQFFETSDGKGPRFVQGTLWTSFLCSKHKIVLCSPSNIYTFVYTHAHICRKVLAFKLAISVYLMVDMPWDLCVNDDACSEEFCQLINDKIKKGSALEGNGQAVHLE